MRKLYEDTSSLTYNDLARRKDTKKDNAQKFYSLLVLQKVPFFSKSEKGFYPCSYLFQFHALDIDQSSIYGDLNITKGPCFEMDTTAVKANWNKPWFDKYEVLL